MSTTFDSPLIRELDISVVERDINAYLATHPHLHTPHPISLASLPTPSTPLTEAALRFARSELDDIMFNHSNRVYYIGKAMVKEHFTDWHVDDECYYLTSLLHDLGVGPKNLQSTRLSFEFYGAIRAREFILQQPGGKQLQNIADEVCEAIIRHTNFVKGKMTSTAELIQLSTTLDVIGANQRHIALQTYDEIAGSYPRLGFNQHFAQLMEREMTVKPWSHTTTVEEENGFCARIRGNPFTKGYDSHPH